jgi:DNA modification methylase
MVPCGPVHPPRPPVPQNRYSPPLTPHPTLFSGAPMIHVPVSTIQISTSRQRREFDPQKLMELQESIEHLGLMHPIVVREYTNGGSPAYTLVAGERRLRALQGIWELGGNFQCHNALVPEGWVPVITMGELGPIEAMEAELSENIIRADLTWQERCEALAALHKLRVALNPSHSVADTSEEVTGRRDARYHNDTRHALIVAKHLDNPIVAKAKDEKEAFKLLKRAEELTGFSLKAIEVGKTFNSSVHQCLQGDCLTWMAEMAGDQFDVILTDPPYGMGADEFGDGAGRLTAIDHAYKDSEDDFRALLSAAIPLFGRVAKPSAALYLCCDIDQFHWLRSMFTSAGWYVFRTPIINVKTGSGRVPLPDQGPRRQYETILFAFRGGKKTTVLKSDVIQTLGDDQMGHGAQKPVALFSDLLARSARPGDCCLDPFAGTGTIFPAAHGLKVVATGIEQNSAYYGMCVKRLEGLED